MAENGNSIEVWKNVQGKLKTYRGYKWKKAV